MTKTAPKVEDAPGLIWRPHREGWEARWQCRTDIINDGFTPKSQRLWTGAAPSEKEAAYISDQCQRLQAEMKLFARGGLPVAATFDGSLRSLIRCYQTDDDSTYRKMRYAVRKNHDGMLKRISDTLGDEQLCDIKGRLLIAWHKSWSNDGQKVAIAHALVGQIRTLVGFGATILEDPDCERISGILHKMRFPMAKPRTEFLTAEMVEAVRKTARDMGWNSIALAQAFQFDLMLRQKDVIGEWVPLSEPGVSDVLWPSKGKWITGLQWSEINENMILRHTTSKRGKDIEVDLRLAPMVMDELSHLGAIPKDGPCIICEATGQPFTTSEFRRKWRIVATKAGVPPQIRNMDSRAGAITEATEAGAQLEHIKHAATHSDISMTQRYARGQAEKTATVMKFRLEHRAKPKT